MTRKPVGERLIKSVKEAIKELRGIDHDWCVGKLPWYERPEWAYYAMVPYEWRPGQIWYRTKCFWWHRYSTVKSRHLSHTWCDKTEAIPYTMFEQLERFVEDECGPEGNVSWYHEFAGKITVDGHEKFVRDEMDDLLTWWNYVYLKADDHCWNLVKDVKSPSRMFVECEDMPGCSEYDPQFESEEVRDTYNKAYKAYSDYEQKMDKELQEHLHRLVNILRWLWT